MLVGLLPGRLFSGTLLEVVQALEIFLIIAKVGLYGALAIAFLVLSWMLLRLARIFSTTEQSIKEVSEEVVPLLGKTHITMDNINNQLSQLDTAVGDVSGITGELDQTTTVLTRGLRNGVIGLSSATAGISRGFSAFFGDSDNESLRPDADHPGQTGARPDGSFGADREEV